MIKIVKTKLPGVIKIYPNIVKDNRGLFYESWNKKYYSFFYKDKFFYQDNITISKKNVLRGLHFQHPKYQQGKLINVIRGKIYDVAVDIRINSPHFGKWIGVVLDDKKSKQIWIPRGFAHGFCVLSKEAIVQYKCTALWSRHNERTIKWDDPFLNIQWPTKKVTLSQKDKNGKLLKEQKSLPIYNNEK